MDDELFDDLYEFDLGESRFKLLLLIEIDSYCYQMKKIFLIKTR